MIDEERIERAIRERAESGFYVGRAPGDVAFLLGVIDNLRAELHRAQSQRDAAIRDGDLLSDLMAEQQERHQRKHGLVRDV